MPTYLYELSYTAESLAAQIKKPQDRLAVAAKPLLDAIGGRLIAGGYAFGEYDVVILFDAPDDESAAALSAAVGAGGAIKAAKTTKLMSGEQWISALKKAAAAGRAYKPAK